MTLQHTLTTPVRYFTSIMFVLCTLSYLVVHPLAPFIYFVVVSVAFPFVYYTLIWTIFDACKRVFRFFTKPSA